MNSAQDDNPLAQLRHDLLHGEVMGDPLPDSADELRRLLQSPVNSHRQFCIWRRLREIGVAPSAEESQEVFGVVGEVGISSGSALIFGLADGSASLYTSTGGGLIGGGGDDNVRRACAKLIDEAQNFADSMPVISEFPYPDSGIIRIAIMTPRGVCAEELEEAELLNGEHKLSRLFGHWNDLVSQLRLTDPRQRKLARRRAAPAYVNCLLTLTWEKSLPPTTITVAGPLPNLRELATTDDDHRFLDQIEVPYDEIDARAVSAIILKLAKFRWYKLAKKSGQLRAKLQTSPQDVIDVCFDVEKTKDSQQRNCLRIARS